MHESELIPVGFEQMTPYEQRAWRQSIDLLYEAPRRRVPASVRTRVSGVTTKAAEKLGDMPGAESAKEIVEKAFEGTLALTFQPAMRSASSDAAVKKFAAKYPHVSTAEDLRLLSLEKRDAMQPSKSRYTAASAGQGAVTAALVTGAEISTTVTAGTTAAVAIGAVAADSVASMAIMGRTIGAVATRYGYDVRLPDEELFAMGVLSLGIAGSVGAKTQALAALSRLTQQMMRQATWKQLNEHLLVQVIAKVYQMLGIRLTQRKLAQAVPVLGIGLNAALSAQLTDRTFKRAQAVYRLRSLSETYGIDPTEWLETQPQGDAGSGALGAEPVVDVIEVLEAERDREEPTPARGYQQADS